MSDITASDRYVVPGLQRGLQLLGQFTRERRELSGAELSRRMDLPRASVFRLLQTLELMGFVERVGDSAHYKLGLAVLQLGFEYLSAMELTEHGRPVLEALSAATGLCAHLVVRDGREVVFVAKAAGQSSLFNSIQVGARLPAHATVLGRVLLINQSATSLRELYDSTPLTTFTPQTPTTLVALKKLIDDIAARGYGISQGGFEAGISTIAAPVFDDRHSVTAAISVTVPASRVAEPRQAELIAHVQAAATRLSQRLSHSPQAAPATLRALEKSTA